MVLTFMFPADAVTMLILSPFEFTSLCLPFQTSMNRKQAENVAKKKLDNLMKESKIRDREDPDSFTIAALPPSGKHDKSPLKVNMLYFTIHVTPSSPGEEMLPHLPTK